MRAPLLSLFTLVLGANAMAQDTTGAPVSAERPAIISRDEWGSQPQPISPERHQTPSIITIHHAGETWHGGRDPSDFVRAMQGWGQRDKGWPDLPYHFLIAPDGRIFEGRPLDYEPESNTNYPLSGHVGVELMGNFEEQRVSEQQMRSVVALVAWLCASQHIDPATIEGHRDAAPGQTDCPGRDFYRYIHDGLIRGWVEQILAGGSPEIEMLPALPEGPTEPIPVN
jgi:hypothetical protein